MKRQLPAAMTSTDVFMGVLIGQMDELIGIFQDRSGQPPREGGKEGVVRLQEPATPLPAEPVQEPAKVTATPSPAEVPERKKVPEPPRAGRGSGFDAWKAFADLVGVTYPADAGRNDIIAACVTAGVITE